MKCVDSKIHPPEMTCTNRCSARRHPGMMCSCKFWLQDQVSVRVALDRRRVISWCVYLPSTFSAHFFPLGSPAPALADPQPARRTCHGYPTVCVVAGQAGEARPKPILQAEIQAGAAPFPASCCPIKHRRRRPATRQSQAHHFSVALLGRSHTRSPHIPVP